MMLWLPTLAPEDISDREDFIRHEYTWAAYCLTQEYSAPTGLLAFWLISRSLAEALLSVLGGA